MEGVLERLQQLGEQQELGAKEFQLVVLQALLQLLREQESLSQTVKMMRAEKKRKEGLERLEGMREDMEALISEDTSEGEEEEEEEDGEVAVARVSSPRKQLKQFRSDETQTGQNVKIMYYHETRQQKEEGGGDVGEPDEGLEDIELEEEGKVVCQYKWKRRIPASKFGEIILTGGRRKDPEFSQEILSFSGSGDTEATTYGKLHEKDGKRKLEQILGVSIQEPKKYIDKEHKFLVCIPDGLIDDDKLVEIKCPFKCADTSMEKLAKEDDNFCLKVTDSGRLKLKEDHPYYYQVQGELHICRKEVCYFVVWSPKEFHYQVIERDEHFWDVQMFPWLLDFHRTHILDEKWKIPDISEVEMKKRSNDILRRLQSSRARQAVIERSTRGQGKNPEWARERRERLTASNFGRVAKMRATTSCENTVVTILYPDRLDNLEAIKYGKENEKRALEELSRLLEERGEEHTRVEECGLFVDVWKGFLAASPDGLVGKDALVEVKCPLRCAELSVEELARTDSNFCLKEVEGSLQLKKNHNYYYQIQGQLHIAARSKCYFLVWSPHGSHLEVVEYDPEFWEDMEDSLENFYINCILPEVVDPRAPRGLPVRDPEYILQAQNLKNMKI